MNILEENSMKKNNIILSLIILAVLTRLLPHPPNVAPITGIALFAGNKFDNKWIGFILPLVCMFLSDLFLGAFIFWSKLLSKGHGPILSITPLLSAHC